MKSKFCCPHISGEDALELGCLKESCRMSQGVLQDDSRVEMPHVSRCLKSRDEIEMLITNIRGVQNNWGLPGTA